jgi:hypothetical protein
MIEKLKAYEQQCRTFHEQSINGLISSFEKKNPIFHQNIFVEFRSILELFERTSSLMAKIELDEQMREGEKVLFELKQQFNMILKENLSESNNTKEKNYDLLRPTFGHPTKKNYLQIIDNQEKQRQEDIHKILEQLRSDTMVNKSRFKINMFFFCRIGKFTNQCSSNY